MTIYEFHKKATSHIGGWTPTHPFPNEAENWDDGHFALMLLTPEAWEAVGKASRWNQWECPECKTQYQMSGHIICPDCNHSGAKEVWRAYMHDMIDALAEGKTIEEYIDTL